jgi:hypothetical protein
MAIDWYFSVAFSVANRFLGIRNLVAVHNEQLRVRFRWSLSLPVADKCLQGFRRSSKLTTVAGDRPPDGVAEVLIRIAPHPWRRIVHHQIQLSTLRACVD